MRQFKNSVKIGDKAGIIADIAGVLLGLFLVSLLFAFALAVPVAAFAAISGLLMLAWNIALPKLFGLPTITYPEALGIWLLVRIIHFTLASRRS